MMALAASFLLTLLIIWLVMRPLLEGGSPQDIQSDLSQKSRALLDQKERCQQMLRDLELDFATKKVSEEEYHSMKAQTEEELSKLVER